MSLAALSKFSSLVDRFIDKLGQVTAWFSLLMVLMTTIIVILRYGFGMGWIAMQESVIYMHAAVFMLGIAYTLKHDEHVRVDIFYQKFSAKNRAWVDLLGTLFILLPVCGFIFYFSLDYVVRSWRILEDSGEAGGIPAVFILKTLIIVMPILLGLQGIATAIKQLLTIVDFDTDLKQDEQSQEQN